MSTSMTVRDNHELDMNVGGLPRPPGFMSRYIRSIYLSTDLPTPHLSHSQLHTHHDVHPHPRGPVQRSNHARHGLCQIRIP